MDKEHEKAARVVHEAYKGKGSWAEAPPDERSKARHIVRLVMSALGGGIQRPGSGSTSPRW